MHIPVATYRIQLNPDFGFKDAAAIVDYLAALGISHLYASPIFASRPGSPHGYDGTDPNRLDPELGSQNDWQALVRRLRDRNMGWLQDFVPNHLAFDSANRMLMDLLENGRHSEYYRFFDIDWDHPDTGLQNRLLTPVLGDRFPNCLDKGEIKLGFDQDGFFAAYYDHRWPLKIESYLELLQQGARRIETAMGAVHPARGILEKEIFGDLRSLAAVQNPSRRRERISRAKKTLWNLYRQEPVRQLFDEILRTTNGQTGAPHSFDALEQILDRQMFRPAYWRTAFGEINYRRFFDINDLICLRQEDPYTFEHTHRLLRQLVAEKAVTGVRIDHIDGLADPEAYLADLRQILGADVFITVEKILAAEEVLPQSWPVQGTTGYDFAAAVNALFVRHEHEETFTELYGRFSGLRQSWEQVVCDGKRLILNTEMAGELDNLAFHIKQAAVRVRSGRDLITADLKAALEEILVRLPIYRTYLGPRDPSDTDRTYLRSAAELAVLKRPHLQPAIAFVLRFLLNENRWTVEETAAELPELRLRAARRFQQLSAPLMAKGCEDTALYIYNRLLSVNEVGDEPGRFGGSIAGFHRFMQQRVRQWPLAMNAGSTHDSKRAEDVRARLNVLSEIPRQWEDTVQRWHGLNRNRKPRHNHAAVPDANEEYFLYQTLIGAWPPDGRVTEAFVERIRSYLRKAAREAKVHSSWLDPDEEYESQLFAFLDALLESSPQNRFRQELGEFAQRVAFYGFFNSLAQTVLKITAPGIPDFYQGSELLQLHLVDPDNRRPVDFETRRRLLSESNTGDSADLPARISRLLEIPDYDRVKFLTTARALQVRRRHAALFQRGRYLPLHSRGRGRRSVVAYARYRNPGWCITVVPRFLTSLVDHPRLPLGEDVWQDTAVDLPQNAPGTWLNPLAEQRIDSADGLAVAEVFRHVPVAILIGETA